MLIYFISLIALAAAAGDNECGTKYICIAPVNQKTGLCEAGKDLVKVEELADPACFAILKIHPYANNWFRIVMEGTEHTSSIEMKQDGTGKVLYSCAKEGDKVNVIYDGAIPKIISSSAIRKLKCEFEIDQRIDVEESANPVLGYSLSGVVLEALANGATIKSKASFINTPRFCSPTAIIMSQDRGSRNKHYAEAKTELGDVYCENSIYKLEFRAEGSDDFKHLDSIKCAGSGKYELNLTGKIFNLPSDDDIDVRCVADAKDFCQYNIDSEPKLKLMEDGKLKCPKESPFFKIRGQRPIKNAELECLNHHGKMKWTFNETITFAETGSQVKCVNTVKCHEMNPINRTSLSGSFLDDQFSPTCQEGGNLKVTDTNIINDDEEITVFCDPKIGEYKYRGKKNMDTFVKNTTIFSCKYHDQQQVISAPVPTTYMTLTIVLIIIAFIIVIVVVMWIIYRRNGEKEKKAKARREVVDAQKQEMSVVDGVEQIEAAEPKEVDTPEKEAKEEVKNDDTKNNYLIQKREEAKYAVQYTIVKEKIPVLPRAKELLSPELLELNGKRAGGVRTFVKYTKRETTSTMENMLEIARKLRPRQ